MLYTIVDGNDGGTRERVASMEDARIILSEVEKDYPDITYNLFVLVYNDDGICCEGHWARDIVKNS